MSKIRTTEAVRLEDGTQFKIGRVLNVVAENPDRGEGEVTQKEASALLERNAAESVRRLRMLDSSAGYNVGECAVFPELEAQKLLALGKAADADPPRREGPARKTKPADPAVKKGLIRPAG